MSGNVKFVNTYDENYLSVKPKIFDHEEDGYPNYCLTDVYGCLYFKGKENEKPISYFRHANPNSYRFGGFTELGDTFIEHQKGGYHHEDIAQKDTSVSGYAKISESPLIYGFSSTAPYSNYHFYRDHVDVEEGDFFKATLKPYPITLIDHHTIFPPMSQISQPCLISGTYEGKEIVGLGSYDRYFMPQDIKKDMGEDLGYICASVSGIREDGRFEMALITINFSGQQCGIYWIEGADPIVSYKVKFEADWKPLPYTDDGTCIYENAVIKFADIVLHIHGKWGTKGFTKEPRVERHGQSQVFGTWYVGDEAYEHKLSNSFMENMNCYKSVLKQYDLI